MAAARKAQESDAARRNLAALESGAQRGTISADMGRRPDWLVDTYA